MLYAVEILEELLSVSYRYLLPDLLEDELVAIGYDARQQRRVEQRDVVFSVRKAVTLAECTGCLFDLGKGGLLVEAQLFGDHELLASVLDPY